MKIKNSYKVILLCLFCISTIGFVYYFLFSQPDQAGNSIADNTFGWKYPAVRFPLTGPNEVAYSDIRDPGGIPQGLPVRLKIPIIGVDSVIEDALITPDGRMDVPAGSRDVAWFALGPHPGDVGSSVIGGHFGIKNGIKFVFYDLDKLKIGDTVYIEDDTNTTHGFVVRSIKLFDRNADATTVFTSTDGLAHLNLITCEGVWNQVNGNYPERRVVFTDAVAWDGTLPLVATFHQTVRIGSRGADVIILQNILREKGFLTGASGTADGIFGSVTRTAVIKYQTSIGVAADGILGPITRAKLFPTPIASIPTLPLTSVLDIITLQTIISATKSVFATPLDGLMTSILILAIFFILFKIIKR